jgi:ribosomal protein S18 acetylase RimI-like enzyme
MRARADEHVLTEMLYEAVYWRNDGAEERPSLEATMQDTRNARYVRGWGREGDVAVVALDRNDEPVGAAWYRHFRAAEPGYGFVSEQLPELSIAVFPEFRGQGVGSLLLGALVARARAAGEPGLSLSVAVENPALRLYQRHGFAIQGEPGDSATMVLTFAEPTGSP